MKKVLFIIVLGFIFISSCKTMNRDDDENISFKGNDLYAFSSYSTSVLLKSYENMNTNVTNEESSETENEIYFSVEDFLDDINIYYDMIEEFIGNNVLDVLSVEERLPSSDFERELKYSLTTLNGNEITQTILFNEDNEGSFSGIIILNDIIYDLEGYIGDDEKKFELKTIDQNNDRNWVKFIEKLEENEIKYLFEISLDGEVETAEVEIENEDDKIKIEIEFKGDNQENDFEFKKVFIGDNEIIKIDYKLGDNKGEIRIRKRIDESGEEIIEYDIESDGKTKVIEKDDPFDEEDDGQINNKVVSI